MDVAWGNKSSEAALSQWISCEVYVCFYPLLTTLVSPHVPYNIQLTFTFIALMQSSSVTDGCEPVELIWLLSLAKDPRAAGAKQRNREEEKQQHLTLSIVTTDFIRICCSLSRQAEYIKKAYMNWTDRLRGGK